MNPKWMATVTSDSPEVKKKKRNVSVASRYRVLIRLIKSANDQLDPSRVIATIMDNIQKIIPSEAWSLLLLSPDQEELIFERAYGVVGPSLTYARLRVGEGIAGWVAQQKQPLIVNDVLSDPRFSTKFDQAMNFKTRSILCAPLLSRNQLLGVVELINRQSRNYRFTKKDLNLLSTLLGLVAVSLHNALLFQETKKLTITDDLTKLYNNRYINHHLAPLIEEHRKSRTCFSVVFLDLDGFKTVNDRFGHLMGGKTLVEVGKVIKNHVKKDGIVARYGGDEFVVILPKTDESEAIKVSEGIRKVLWNHRFESVLPEPIRLSASFGISVYPAHAENLIELIQKADQAMYAVKFSGKNSVKVAEF